MTSPTDISKVIDDWTSETRTQWYQSPEHARAIGRLADLARTALRERDDARARIDELERHCAALSSEVHDLRPFREVAVRLECERDEARAETERVRDALSAEHGQRVALGDRLAHWQHVAREMEAGMHRVDAELAAERERSRKLVEALRCGLAGDWDRWQWGLRAALAEYERGEP
jgi:chromosome segregation ATPase